MQTRSFFLVLAIWLAVVAGHTQTVSVLHVFPFGQSDGSVTTNSDGSGVVSSLLVSSNKLYGTAATGGTNGNGTIFSMDLNGSNFMVLHTFSKTTGSGLTNSDGASPSSGLVLSSNTLYGMTQYGGAAGWGTIFSLNTNGSSFTNLHIFTNQPDGAGPLGDLLLVGDTLYGTTDAGGAGVGSGHGIVFSVRTNGTNFAVLHAFTGTPDGENPVTGLVLSGGKLFGTTQQGGTNGSGTVFSIGTNGGNYTRLRSFTNSPDGKSPRSTLLISGSRIFGTTASGGTNNNGTIYSLGTNGANYAILYKFTNSPNGSGPIGNLALSNDTIYGITGSGGTNGSGSLYSISTNGQSETILHSYTFLFDGFFPFGGPVLSGQTLYASTSQGGGGAGAIISLDLSGPPPAISNIVANADGSVTINFLGGANKTYLVQSTTNLSPPVVWQNISTNTSAGDGTWLYLDTNAVRTPAQFFRAATP
jgi:uncharacterized repeat protein (TIGR03803 family)